jgi:predicted ATPase
MEPGLIAIQQLEIRDFRSFHELNWQPRKLNLLVGPNGSGKSNLLRILQLISNVGKGRLGAALTESSGFVPLLWDHRAPSLYWKLRIDSVDPGQDQFQDALTLEFELRSIPGTSSYEIVADSLGNWVKFDQGIEKSPYWIYQRDLRRAMVYDKQANKLARFDDPDPNESLLTQISDPRTNPITTHARRFLEGWRVYHDVDDAIPQARGARPQ